MIFAFILKNQYIKASNLCTAVFGLVYDPPKYAYLGWRGFVYLFVEIPRFKVPTLAPGTYYFFAEVNYLFLLGYAPLISFVIRE